MTLPSAISLLHQHLWQRLPRAWRREALFRATALAAPKPTIACAAGLPIIVVGALKTASGLGQSARLCHDALKAAGLPVYGIDVTQLLMQVLDAPDFAYADGRDLGPGGTLIIHVNAPTLPLVMAKLGRSVVKNRRVVACWAWELSRVPDDWKHGIQFAHEIWVPSAFTAHAIAPLTPHLPLWSVPYAVALAHANASQRPQRSADKPFTVLTIFNTASSFARKNPCASITAFRQAFGDDDAHAKLIVKASNLSAFPSGREELAHASRGASNIRIVEETLSTGQIDALYDDADAFISLHRSEGFGLTLAEAMLRGVPVVATNWSGNVDFLNETTGIPVSFKLIPAVDPQGSYHFPALTWADADVGAAASGLRRLRDDPAFAARLSAQAFSYAHEAWSSARFATAVCKQLAL